MINECLLGKWIIKLETGDNDLCSTLLRNKYLQGKGFFRVRLEGCISVCEGALGGEIHMPKRAKVCAG
jgi:hypothetical protein